MSWFDRNLGQVFRDSAEHERVLLAQRTRRRDKERARDKDAQDDTTANDLVSALEQVVQIREMERRLDALEEQVTEALIENDRRLDQIKERLDFMLSQAVVLPDGRRVFKTEDGTQVFDEHGQEVAPDVVSPDSIPDDRPKWEVFEKGLQERDALLDQREQLLDLQQDIDAAREASENGTLDMSDLDALEAEFGVIRDAEIDPAASPGIVAQADAMPSADTKDATTKFEM